MTTTCKQPACSTARRRTGIEDGFVLVVVLWWLVLLTFMLTQITSDSRTQALIAANLRSSAIAETEADGAVFRAIFEVLAHRWEADGAPHVIRDGQGVAEVRVYDEARKVDPNVAPAALMEALLRACGATPKVAGPLALGIYQWRSVDLLQEDFHRFAPDYRAANLDYIPPNKRFVSEDELGLVLGMTPDLLACLTPHISIYASSVPSFDSTDDRLIRQALTETSANDVVTTAVPRTRDAAVIRIQAVAQAAHGGSFRRVAVARVAPAAVDPHFAYKILLWIGETK
jgi:general secretion pathway protein K